jgi:hypothetical protein
MARKSIEKYKKKTISINRPLYVSQEDVDIIGMETLKEIVRQSGIFIKNEIKQIKKSWKEHTAKEL